MPALTIKNIPDELYEHLRASAQAHRRSINSELIHCLEVSLMPAKTDALEVLAQARAIREKIAVYQISSEEIDTAKREGRE